MSAVAATAGFASPLRGAGDAAGSYSSHGPGFNDLRRFLGGQANNACRYWPCELLSAFVLQMAAKGFAVNTSMMLGSRDYALEKLTQAHLLKDKALAELSARMFEYFDDEPCHAVLALVELTDLLEEPLAH